MRLDVIVRAAGGKPAHLIALETADDLVYVANPGSLERIRAGETEAVGVPKSDVYSFDIAAFTTLLETWERNAQIPDAIWDGLPKAIN